MTDGDRVTTTDSIKIQMQKITETSKEDTADVLYINQIKRCYRTDFVRLSKAECKKLCKNDKHIRIHEDNDTHDFFVYNKKSGDIFPFKKNDYLMDETWYMIFDGTAYRYYDNYGTKKWYMVFDKTTCCYYDNDGKYLWNADPHVYDPEPDVEDLDLHKHHPKKKNSKQPKI